MGMYLKSKFISTNCMDYIHLHDCSVRWFTTSGSDLLLEFDQIFIMKTHPLNTTGKSKYTGVAALLLKDYTISESLYYTESSREGSVVHCDTKTAIDFFALLNRFEVLSVEETEKTDDTYCYRFVGDWWHENACDFAEFTVQCRGIDVGWDEFEGDAWFDKPHKPGEAATAPDGSAIWIVGKD